MDKNIKRTDLINHLIRKHGLKRYLEIGLQDATQNFDKIECGYKVSVDPDPKAKASFCMTSNEFFKTGFDSLFVNSGWETKFDLVFIDGMHTAEQVKKDFDNALKILSPNGFIVLHDCNPLKEEHTIVPRPTERGHWNGDVYKFASSVFCKKITVDIDNGCTVIQNQTGIVYSNTWPKWSTFNDFRVEMLNLKSWDEFIEC